LFFAEPTIGGDYLIYRRYDGHHALLTGDLDAVDTVLPGAGW
jgi:hypothetical protein